MDRCIENVIELLENQERATVTFSQGRYKNRIKKLASEHPGECEIVAENTDGSLCAHVPVSWVKIIPTPQLTDEQRERKAEAMRRIRNADCNQRENSQIGLETV